MRLFSPLLLLCLTSGYARKEREALAPFPKTCFDSHGIEGPCATGDFQWCSAPPYATGPRFHIHDRNGSCPENDPTALFYDKVHGIYHHFMQVRNDVPLMHRHAASRDLVHWTYLPTPLYPGPEWYDAGGLPTGSVTVLDETPVWVYPGLSRFGETLNMASPANASDPFYTHWQKSAYNPIANKSQRDPSTAWRVAETGEWRFTIFGASVYVSSDFKNWQLAKGESGLNLGECPSLFLLPSATQGSWSDMQPEPTHVNKASINGTDFMHVGQYVSGVAGSAGRWHDLLPPQEIDAGRHFYASKDMYDPVKSRRLLWGWIKRAPNVLPGSTDMQTLPREVTWHQQLQQLVFSPIQELTALRKGTVGSLTRQVLKADRIVRMRLLGDSGKACEVQVSFDRPSVSARLSVYVMLGESANQSTELFIDYQPPANGISEVTVGSGHSQATLKLLPQDQSIDLRLFVDYAFTEVFWMDGRVAMTVASPSGDSTADVAVGSSHGGVTVVSATVWSMNSLWVTQDEILQTPRLDKQNALIV